MDEEPALRRPPPPMTWRDRLEVVADATGVTPARLLAGSVLVLVAGAGALWLLRPPSDPVEVALPFASTTAPAEPATTASSLPSPLVVHVAGAVQVPGVHELPSGARVVDAIDAAGGLRGDADGARLNLAAPVADGERVYVPALGEEPPPAVAGATGGSTSAGSETASGPVDLNTADSAALEALPGIGPATAAAILAHRDEIGRFSSVDQLLDVRGIGEAKLEQLRPHVTV